MNTKRVCNMFAATVLTCSLVVVPVFAAPNTSSLEQQKQAAESEVSGLQSQLSTLMSKTAELSNQLITKGEEISQAEKQLAEVQEKEKQQYEDMKLRIKYMYEEGDGTAVERILNSGSVGEMLSQAEYVQKVHSYDRDMLNEYVDTVTEVAELKTTLEEDQSKLETMQVELESQKTELNVTLENKSTEIANLGQQIQEAARIAAEEEAARQAAAAEEAARVAAANAAASASNQENISTSNTPTSNPPTQAPSTGETQETPSTGGATVAPPSNDNSAGGGNVSAAQTIVNAAWTQIGVPYVWGGTSPYSGLDCSGLTQWCHAQAGISIGRIDTDQLYGGRAVSDPQPGDIAWTPGHVAIYIGNGQMIEAQQPGTTICVSAVRASVFVRYW